MAELTDTSETSPTIQGGPSTSLDNLENFSTSVPESAQGICNNVLGGEGNGSVRDTQTSEVASNNEGSLVASEQTSQVASEQTSQVASEQTSQVASEQTSQVASEQTSQVASEQTSQVASEQTSQVASEHTSQVASEQTSQGEQATTDIQVPNLSTPAIQVTTNDNDETLDMKAMQEQIHSLSKELDDKKKELDTFKQMFQEERQRSSESARLLELKSRSLQEEKEKSSALEAQLLQTSQSLEDSEDQLQQIYMYFQSYITNFQNNFNDNAYMYMTYQYESRLYDLQRAILEDRTSGRPPRCCAITGEGTPCLRYAKGLIVDNSLCLQHYKMRYGDQ